MTCYMIYDIYIYICRYANTSMCEHTCPIVYTWLHAFIPIAVWMKIHVYWNTHVCMYIIICSVSTSLWVAVQKQAPPQNGSLALCLASLLIAASCKRGRRTSTPWTQQIRQLRSCEISGCFFRPFWVWFQGKPAGHPKPLWDRLKKDSKQDMAEVVVQWRLACCQRELTHLKCRPNQSAPKGVNYHRPPLVLEDKTPKNNKATLSNPAAPRFLWAKPAPNSSQLLSC